MTKTKPLIQLFHIYQYTNDLAREFRFFLLILPLLLGACIANPENTNSLSTSTPAKMETPTTKMVVVSPTKTTTLLTKTVISPTEIPLTKAVIPSTETPLINTPTVVIPLKEGTENQAVLKLFENPFTVSDFLGKETYNTAYAAKFPSEEHASLIVEWEGQQYKIALNGLEIVDVKWSPNCSEIAVTAFHRDGAIESSDIYILDMMDKKWDQITDYPSSEGNPSWSVDGNNIAFDALDDQHRPQIYVLNIPTNITCMFNKWDNC